jgi:hypothetical protein
MIHRRPQHFACSLLTLSAAKGQGARKQGVPLDLKLRNIVGIGHDKSHCQASSRMAKTSASRLCVKWMMQTCQSESPHYGN